MKTYEQFVNGMKGKGPVSKNMPEVHVAFVFSVPGEKGVTASMEVDYTDAGDLLFAAENDQLRITEKGDVFDVQIIDSNATEEGEERVEIQLMRE